MPDFLQLPLRLPADAPLRLLFAGAMNDFYVFTLVLVRISGLMTVGPVFGQSVVPVNVRVLIVVSVALLVTPALHDHWRVGFDRLDADGNGRLSRSEVPDHLLDRFDRRVAEQQRDPRAGLAPDEFVLTMRFPSTLPEYVRVAAGEFALGLVLGLGVFIVLSGLQLAGELIDQQTGLALGEISNPGFDTSGSINGQMLYLLGVVVILVAEPVGAHVLILTALIETFQTLPAGSAFVGPDVIDYLSDLVHQSLVLAVQAAAPMLAVMSLAALAMGYLGHTVPQINVLVIGFPVRALISVLVLVLSLSGAARLVVDKVPEAIDTLRQLLMQSV